MTDTAAFEHISYAVADHVATITLNRPDKLNAFTATMALELIAAFDVVDADDDVRAVVVTGAGRGFCAGADLSGGRRHVQLRRGRGGVAPRRRRARHAAHLRVPEAGDRRDQRPVGRHRDDDAAADGHAPGVDGGALRLRVRAARHRARRRRRRWFLPRIVGISRALEWCETGRIFGAEEALAGGLVRSVHEPDDLLPAALRARARDRREHGARVGRADAADAVAHGRRRPSDGGAQGRLARDRGARRSRPTRSRA